MKKQHTLSTALGTSLLIASFALQAGPNLVRVFDVESEDWVVISLAGEEAYTKTASSNSSSVAMERRTRDEAKFTGK